MPTLEEYPDLGIKYDPEGAKALIEAYMAEKGISDPSEIKIELMHNTSENHAKIAVAVQQMWKDTLGIGITTAHTGVRLRAGGGVAVYVVTGPDLTVFSSCSRN